MTKEARLEIFSDRLGVPLEMVLQVLQIGLIAPISCGGLCPINLHPWPVVITLN